MVHKAAGQLPKLFDHADPEDVVRTFITALNMGERRIAAMTFADAEHRQLAFFNRLRQLDIPESGRPPGLERTPDPFAVEVPLEIRMQRSDGHTSKLVCTFHLKRNAIYGPWKIDFVTMVGREPFR